MMKVCKGDRSKIVDASDRWPVGSLVTTKLGDIGLVLANPSVNDSGKPSVSLLIDGSPQSVLLEKVKRSRKKSTSKVN
jgi:hypothetical protein